MNGPCVFRLGPQQEQAMEVSVLCGFFLWENVRVAVQTLFYFGCGIPNSGYEMISSGT
jgi:hypothetical protein